MEVKSYLLQYYQKIETMTSGKTIGENIKKFRAKLGLTQDDLAKKTDVKYTRKGNQGFRNRPRKNNLDIWIRWLLWLFSLFRKTRPKK